MVDQKRVEIGLRLKQAREYLGLSQEEAAKSAKISRSAISLIENGQRKLDSVELMNLAKLYQHPVSYFTGDESAELSTDEVSALARNYAELSDNDKKELMQFAEFLAMRSKRES